MKAAVVDDVTQAPRYRDVEPPQATSDEVIVHTRAAALSQLVRAQASGRHYSSPTPPFVPGADGVGLLDGKRVYFAFPRQPVGAMAEHVAVARSNVIAVPDSVDDITAAAIANPGMSSWAALTGRASFKPGESVLINGATGASGRLAIQIARHLGAGRIVATGRHAASPGSLLALGADDYIALENGGASLKTQLATVFTDGLDIVLDYLWGAPAAAILAAIALVAVKDHGADEAAARVRFVNIGSLAGAAMDLPAGTLRSSGIELMGSGLGSVSQGELVASIAGVFAAIAPAKLAIEARAVPLTDVARHWSGDSSGRLVFTLS